MAGVYKDNMIRQTVMIHSAKRPGVVTLKEPFFLHGEGVDSADVELK